MAGERFLSMKLIRNDIFENLKMALDTLWSNRLRSFLTVIGVVIGVWTVMAIASIISGIDYAVTSQIESFGTNSIFLYKYEKGLPMSRPSREERMRKNLTYDDAEALSQLPAIELAVPTLNVSNDFFGRRLSIKGGGKESTAVNLQGTTAEYERAGIWVIQAGRFFTKEENDRRDPVCVVGASVADNFFPFLSPLDRTIEIGGTDFRVVGILEKREQLRRVGWSSSSSPMPRPELPDYRTHTGPLDETSIGPPSRFLFRQRRTLAKTSPPVRRKTTGRARHTWPRRSRLLLLSC